MTEKELIQKGVDLTVNSMMKHFIEEIAELKRKHELAIEILQAENKDLENENLELRNKNESLKVKNLEMARRNKIEIKHLKRLSTRKLKKAKKIFDEDFSEMLKDKESEIAVIKQKHHEEVEEIKANHLQVVEAQKNQLDKLQNALLVVINQQQFAEKNEQLMAQRNEKLMTDWKNSNISIFKSISKLTGCHKAWTIALNRPGFPELSDTKVTVQGDVMNVYDYQFRKCVECKNPYSNRCLNKPNSRIQPSHPIGNVPIGCRMILKKTYS